MRFDELLAAVGGEPCFTTGLLLAGDVDPSDIRRQLSRWVAAGRIIQLRRGVYVLAEPFRKAPLHPFVLANAMQHASYVSLQSALGHYGLIPEQVPVTTSVSSGRPRAWHSRVGTFVFRHISPSFFHSYTRVEVLPQLWAFVASPEKALCDLIHLTPGSDSREYLLGLRLQELHVLDLPRLRMIAARGASPKVVRAVDRAVALAREHGEESRG